MPSRTPPRSCTLRANLVLIVLLLTDNAALRGRLGSGKCSQRSLPEKASLHMEPVKLPTNVSSLLRPEPATDRVRPP